MLWAVPTPRWPLEHWPFNSEWFEESEADEVPGSGSEGPEEVLPQVSLLQGEVLVGFQAGAHLSRRVDVLFPQCLFSKILVLAGHKVKGQRRAMSCPGPWGTRAPATRHCKLKFCDLQGTEGWEMEVILAMYQAGECVTGPQDTASGEAAQRNTPVLCSDPAHQGAFYCPCPRSSGNSLYTWGESSWEADNSIKWLDYMAWQHCPLIQTGLYHPSPRGSHRQHSPGMSVHGFCTCSCGKLHV